MAEDIKDFLIGMPWYMYLILILVFGLYVASWIVPPIGIISASALQAGAIVLGFAWLFYTTANIPVFIQRGAKIKASYGNANITIGKTEEEKDGE